MKEKIRILPVKAVTKRKNLIRVNTAKPRPEIRESVADPPPEIPIIDLRRGGVENLLSRELVASVQNRIRHRLRPWVSNVLCISCLHSDGWSREPGSIARMVSTNSLAVLG
jgi:hypothetical protein